MRASPLRVLLAILVLAFTCLVNAEDQVAWTANAPSGKAGDVVTIELKATIAKGYHLYSTKEIIDGPSPTSFEAVKPLVLAGPVTSDQPLKKLDNNFGKEVEFFENQATFKVPVKLGAEGAKGSLKVTFMTCNDRMCVPPQTVTVPLGGSVGKVAAAAGSTEKPAVKEDPSADTFTKTVADAKAGGILAFAGLSFSLGLLSLLTPCVFPMVPITVSYFAKRRESLGAKAGLSQAAAYCLGIIGSFAGFGLLVTALFGASGINRFATNPFVNLALGVLFVVLALSLFGMYQLALPASVTNRFSPHGKAGLVGPILMGLTFTLTSFTCTVPFVGTILASAAQGDILYPLLGMVSFGSAFALPFFLLALFPQYLAKLPKSGSWMETMKAFMGFLELAAAIKFFSNADLVWSTGVLPRPVFLGLWVVFALGAALFLMGWLKLPHVNPGKPGPYRYGFAVLSLGCAVWLATAIPGRSLGEAEAFLPPGKSDWIQTYDKGVELAKKSGKPLLVNFTGVTCTNCRWMEKNMFTAPDVAREFGNYVLVELYTDRQRADDQQNKALQQKLTGVVTLPVYVAMTPEGEVHKVFQGSTRSQEEFVGFLKSGRAKLASR